MTARKEAFERLEEPQERGDASEAIVKAELVARGARVLVPGTDNEPYDLVVDAGDSFHRLQVKTAYPVTEGAVRFEARSTRVKSDGYVREGYAGKIDHFAVYSPETDRVYLVGVEEAGSSGMRLRYGKTGNGQSARVNWHVDFLLDERLDALLPPDARTR